MSDVIAWFREQLDQDEVQAAKIRNAVFSAILDHYGMDESDADDQAAASAATDAVMHRMRWNPVAVLADIAAKRAVLDSYELAADADGAQYANFSGGYADGLDRAIELLAQAYAGRPGFDPSWRVT